MGFEDMMSSTLLAVMCDLSLNAIQVEVNDAEKH
jgi:hypothetical protein